MCAGSRDEVLVLISIIEVEKRKRMYKWTAFFFLGTTALAGLRAGGLAGPFT